MSSKRVIVDPITRIEGHLRVEVEVDADNKITKAFASSTLWRGIEVILKGRSPFDAGLIAQRICGVCTYSHYRTSIEAVENALKVKIPLNAKLIRSIMLSSLHLHDHIVHFYHLHALDFVDINEILTADPKKAAELALKYTKKPIAAGEGDLVAVQKRIKDLVATGKLGPFANAYSKNPTYKFTPEQNLIAVSHYLKALEIQRIAAEMLAIFGGKSPHPQSLVVGGVTMVRDMLSPSRLQEWKQKHAIVADFVKNAYRPDILMAAEAYANEPSVTVPIPYKNFLTTNEFFLGSKYLFENGVIMKGDLSNSTDLNNSLIAEDVTHSWYKGHDSKHPYQGETIPEYTGFIDRDTVYGHLPTLKTEEKYSWVKSPRYNGAPVEVGPLASLLVNYAKNNKIVVEAVNSFLKEANIPVEILFTTLGRTAARMLQSELVADHILDAFDALVLNLKSDQSTYTKPDLDFNQEYIGVGMTEAPRGMLSHWIKIKNGKIENYQAVVPTTWNAGPIDKDNQMGPFESSLIGVTLSDPTKPLEVIRIIHSFDPCMACSVHVLDYKGADLGVFQIKGN